MTGVEKEKGAVMSHRILQHFNYPNRDDMRKITDPYQSLAHVLQEILDEGPEKDLAMQRLLESCDWAIRAHEIDKVNKRHDMLISALSRSVGRSKPGMIPQQVDRS